MDQKQKITSLRVPSFRVNHKADMAALVIRFVCILKNMKLSDTEIYVLAHFMVEGYNQISKEQIIEGKLLKNKSSLANTLSAFRKNGILITENFKETLAPDFRFILTDKLNINITLDNS